MTARSLRSWCLRALGYAFAWRCARPVLREYEPVLAALRSEDGAPLRCAPYRTPAQPHAISQERNGSDERWLEMGDVAGVARGSLGRFACARGVGAWLVRSLAPRN